MWEPVDRAKAVAYVLEEGLRCTMCGTADWEWQEDQYAYEPVDQGCHGCYLKHKASEGGSQRPGTTVALMPTRTLEAQKRRLKQEQREQRRRERDGE